MGDSPFSFTVRRRLRMLGKAFLLVNGQRELTSAPIQKIMLANGFDWCIRRSSDALSDRIRIQALAGSVCGVHTPYISLGTGPSDEALGIVGLRTLQPGNAHEALAVMSAG